MAGIFTKTVKTKQTYSAAFKEINGGLDPTKLSYIEIFWLASMRLLAWVGATCVGEDLWDLVHITYDYGIVYSVKHPLHKSIHLLYRESQK